mmetsp:Transcript_57655/g.67314  ORF Transcript_57655/g.67314 Transcript_57655/m.67314 type:complete len:82 (+) Transcript_57655:99-344(+)
MFDNILVHYIQPSDRSIWYNVEKINSIYLNEDLPIILISHLHSFQFAVTHKCNDDFVKIAKYLTGCPKKMSFNDKAASHSS